MAKKKPKTVAKQLQEALAETRAQRELRAQTRARNQKGSYGQARDEAGHFVGRGKGKAKASDVAKAKAIMSDTGTLRLFYPKGNIEKLKKAITKRGGIESASGYAFFLRILYDAEKADQYIRSLYGKAK